MPVVSTLLVREPIQAAMCSLEKPVKRAVALEALAKRANHSRAELVPRLFLDLLSGKDCRRRPGH
jgi:hypothetical protein